MRQASHYIVHSFIAVSVRSFHLLMLTFFDCFFVMSSKNKSKHKNKCPGCGTPKDQHDFDELGKHCEGPEEPDLDCNIY